MDQSLFSSLMETRAPKPGAYPRGVHPGGGLIRTYFHPRHRKNLLPPFITIFTNNQYRPVYEGYENKEESFIEAIYLAKMFI